MEANHLENPAGRLWAALQHVRSFQRSNDQKPITLRVAFCEYFDISAEDDASYYANISSLMRLPVEIRGEVAQLDDPYIPADQLIRPLPTVERFLATYAQGRHPVHKVTSEITDGVMNDIEACSHILSRMRESVALSTATLEEIRSATGDLIAAILADASLPPRLKQTLLRLAYQVLHTVDEYKVVGGDAVLDAWDTMAGMVARNAPNVAGHKKVWAAIKHLAAIVSTVVVVATAPEQIGEGIEYIGELFAIEGVTEAPGEPQATGVA